MGSVLVEDRPADGGVTDVVGNGEVFFHSCCYNVGACKCWNQGKAKKITKCDVLLVLRVSRKYHGDCRSV